MKPASVLTHLHAAIEDALSLAIDDGYRGHVWGWLAQDGDNVTIEVTRVEPTWPVKNAVSAIQQWDVTDESVAECQRVGATGSP